MIIVGPGEIICLRQLKDPEGNLLFPVVIDNFHWIYPDYGLFEDCE